MRGHRSFSARATNVAETPHVLQILPYCQFPMPTRSPIIAFLVASPFELLDLTGPASVFAYATVRDRPYYSFRILSTTSGETVKSMGGIFIADTCTFSDYAGPIDTLIVVGGLGSLPGAFVASLLIGLVQTFAVSMNGSLDGAFLNCA